MRRGVLFLSYDGVLEPLGQSQVLAYLEELSLKRKIHLISFEKSACHHDVSKRQALIARTVSAGICWYPLRYHKRFSVLATSWDVVRGTVLGIFLVIRYDLAIVHARSYVPSIMALVIVRLTGAKYIFDMRGFWADERVDGGLWASGCFMFRVAKWFERRFLLNADHVISLTFSALRTIKNFDYLKGRMPPLTVIPTCADLRRFKPQVSRAQNVPFVLGYTGSVGTWYMFDEVIKVYTMLLSLKPDSKLLIVSRSDPQYIKQRLVLAGVSTTAVEITSAPHSEMPSLMARMSAGIFFIKPTFSKQASAPTRLGEFLGCGIPCLSNKGVGDMAEVLITNRVGIVIPSFNQASLNEGLLQLLSLCADSHVSDRCVVAAKKHFSLDEGVARYEQIYSALGE